MTEQASFRPRALVSIGMPVRNGAPYFKRALADVLAQDYPNLEIIISDNGSTDDTGEVIARAAAQDSRIKTFVQQNPLTAFDHFAWVLRQSTGQYFMWAAHDDLRPADYVSVLVDNLEAHPNAVLAFGDLRTSAIFNGTYAKKPFVYESLGKPVLQRMRQAAFLQCYAIYGVWRASDLKRIPFIFNAWWPDLPLMVAAASQGEFVRAADVCFDYLEIPKTNEQRAHYQDNTHSINRVSRTLKLFHVMFQTVRPVAGVVAACAATCFIIEKQFWVALGLLTGRIRRGDY